MSYSEQVCMPNVVQDLLSLLHEDWLPDKRKDSIKKMLMDMVDKMESLEHDEWK